MAVGMARKMGDVCERGRGCVGDVGAAAGAIGCGVVSACDVVLVFGAAFCRGVTSARLRTSRYRGERSPWSSGGCEMQRDDGSGGV